MSRPVNRERRRERARRELAAKGWTAVVVGLVLLVVTPSFLRGPIALALASALRPAGWAALAIGVALLLLHFALRRADAASVGKRKATLAPMPTPTPTSALDTTAQPMPWHERQEPVFAHDLPVAHGAAPEPVRNKEQQWSAAVFASIEWRRFEAVCEAFFAQAGLATRSQSHGADGGVDIWLQSMHMDMPRIVQCKHWQGKPVGVREMREFRGVMASHQLESGSYVTSSTFTDDATAFAKANKISLQDGAALLRQISLRTPEQQSALLTVAYEGDYWRPTCASCGIKMVEKTRKRDAAKFWGCSNYPRCKTTIAMRH